MKASELDTETCSSHEDSVEKMCFASLQQVKEKMSAFHLQKYISKFYGTQCDFVLELDSNRLQQASPYISQVTVAEVCGRTSQVSCRLYLHTHLMYECV